MFFVFLQITLSNLILFFQDIAVISPDSLTHYPNNPLYSPDIIDLAIMKTGRLQYRLDNFPSDLTSDYTPIILDLLCHTFQISPPKPLHITNWLLFEPLISEISYPSANGSSTTNIDSATTNLTNILFTNVQKITLAIPSSDTNHTLLRTILLKINFKRHLLSLWQRFRNPLVKTAFNRQNARVKELMLEYRNSQ